MADPNTKERQLRSLVKAMAELNAYTKGAVVVPENRFDALNEKPMNLSATILFEPCGVAHAIQAITPVAPGWPQQAEHNDAARARSRRSIRQTRQPDTNARFCHVSSVVAQPES